ncbi:glycosyl hydrolase family 17 protein [Aestuariibacter salexigens]|uniref:glycosyl hydrolase family 17 protein n=1 Tax=Aestuariibacter salexigens TaxID=226010 RepID=UPI00040AB864|nr:glycosyl hydrolase family 17 protein [Aestuariibacter salexigens]
MTNNTQNQTVLSPANYGRAICYSGYRDGQNPALGIYPSYSEILEDLLLLKDDWQCLRVYDAGPHAHTLLEVIKREKLHFKVLLGMDIAAEESNPGCPWLQEYPDHELAANMRHNDAELQRVIRLATEYREHVMGISVGNEATVDWTDHKISTSRLLSFVRELKAQTDAPITFCENYVPWARGDLDALAHELDWIALHTYPLWESRPIYDALEYTKLNYHDVAHRFPDKPVIITEAGWSTNANGRGFPAEFANEQWQAEYCKQLLNWSQEQGILTFLFEAFDESWKGSDDPAEPEKHWGIYRLNRQPKPVLDTLFS